MRKKENRLTVLSTGELCVGKYYQMPSGNWIMYGLINNPSPNKILNFKN